jgi:hypothetical protein
VWGEESLLFAPWEKITITKAWRNVYGRCEFNHGRFLSLKSASRISVTPQNLPIIDRKPIGHTMHSAEAYYPQGLFEDLQHLKSEHCSNLPETYPPFGHIATFSSSESRTLVGHACPNLLWYAPSQPRITNEHISSWYCPYGTVLCKDSGN